MNTDVCNRDFDNKIHDDMEIRSEKVRNLLEYFPRSLLRWSIAIIVTVFVGLIAAVCLLPYPYSDGESIISHILNVD